MLRMLTLMSLFYVFILDFQFYSTQFFQELFERKMSCGMKSKLDIFPLNFINFVSQGLFWPLRLSGCYTWCRAACPCQQDSLLSKIQNPGDGTVRPSSLDAVRNKYRDSLADFHCLHKHIFEVKLFTVPGTTPGNYKTWLCNHASCTHPPLPYSPPPPTHPHTPLPALGYHKLGNLDPLCLASTTITVYLLQARGGQNIGMGYR